MVVLVEDATRDHRPFKESTRSNSVSFNVWIHLTNQLKTFSDFHNIKTASLTRTKFLFPNLCLLASSILPQKNPSGARRDALIVLYVRGVNPKPKVHWPTQSLPFCYDTPE